MPPLSDITVASVALSSLILLIAAGLAWREWRDRRDRSSELSDFDVLHFARQDRRRLVGIVVLGILAVALVVGSRLPAKFENRANPPFVGIWLGVFLLIFALLWLAMLDWVSLRRFANRQRRTILRERIEILSEEVRRRKALGDEGNGHTDGPIRDLFR